MTAAAAAWPAPARRWLAPEVVQTSAMDCGPAALKCVLEGFGIPVSYGRLREACQTGLDGTSIDTLEQVAPPLGVAAEQVMVPLDHVFLRGGGALPAIVVVRHADGATHFVVVWRQVGTWLQVMDPATGRRWVRATRFADEVLRHEHGVAEADWRGWAASGDFLTPLRLRLARLGVPAADAAALETRALADAGWFPIGALDAAVRLVQALQRNGGLPTGAAAAQLVCSLFERACSGSDDIFALIPQRYWSAVPDPASAELGHLQLRLRGAVLLRVTGSHGAATSSLSEQLDEAVPALPPELRAALRERDTHPLRTVWQLLRQDGLLAPLALAGAMVAAAGAVVVEGLLLRGLVDLAGPLQQPAQRLFALAALLAFVGLLLCLEWPIVSESLRLGRHLEARLRMALLDRMPRLGDRYFQSRSVSDMADRSHSLQLVRNLPTLGMNLVQSLSELTLTLVGVAIIAPGSAPWALAVVGCALAVPAALQALLTERDLRLRSHGSALNGFYLDALLGLVPVRTHRAERAVSRQHEGLLVAWARSSRGMALASLGAQALQGTLTTGLTGWLLFSHFQAAGSVSGSDLLLVYWTLKLPALGSSVGSLLRQYPTQHNVLLRLLEPLRAPHENDASSRPAPDPDPALTATAPPGDAAAAAIHISEGRVLAGGHTLLQGVNLRVAPGEHIAIVGASGAGKSTLVGLLLGWHRLAEGQLCVDGQVLGGAAQEALRRHTAWVDPSVQLWNRSLLDNLGSACDDAALARIGPVIDAAQLRPVLQKLPDGLQTRLGEGGALLSGGEGQRVRLARAMLQTDVRLALLDEPFRGLDRGQRQGLLAAARSWWASATLLCVTHDIGETLGFARVLVVEGGCIVEDGSPAALAAAPSRYSALLAAERRLQAAAWRGDGSDIGWRRLRLGAGHLAEVTERGAAGAQKPSSGASATSATTATAAAT